MQGRVGWPSWIGVVVDDLGGKAAREVLIAAGAEPISETEGGDNRWAYFRDPEGNMFDITERQPRSGKPG
jgi:hypothetical protein